MDEVQRARNLERFLQLASRGIEHHEVALAALLLSPVDPERFLTYLRNVAAPLPHNDVEAVMNALFGGDVRFDGNTTDYYDPANQLLASVIERRLGAPITLSVLTMEVALHAGCELRGVGLPGHFIVSETRSGLFYDPFHRGRRLDATGCRALVAQVTGQQQWDPNWLTPVSGDDIVIRILNNLKAAAQRRQNHRLLHTVMTARVSFPALAHEQDEFRRILARWN